KRRRDDALQPAAVRPPRAVPPRGRRPGRSDAGPATRVHDIKVETLARCGAGWQPARRLATAAVRCQRGIWPIDNRPQLAKLPHKSPRCLAYTYARIQAVLLMNRLGVHFCVAHPPIRFRLTPITRKRAPSRRMEPFELLHQVSGANP